MGRFVSLCVVLVMIAAPAFAEDDAEERRSYIGLEAGMGVMNGFKPGPGIPDSGFEVGGAAALRVGVQWSDHIRFDGLLGWNGSGIGETAGRLDIAYATANAFYDFGAPESRVRPYLGAGLGVAGGWLTNNLVPSLASQSGVGLAYIIFGGARFRLTDSLSLAAAWHFLGTAVLIEQAGGGSIDPTMHAFMVGLHQAF